jgi:hypothetical protein
MTPPFTCIQNPDYQIYNHSASTLLPGDHPYMLVIQTHSAKESGPSERNSSGNPSSWLALVLDQKSLYRRFQNSRDKIILRYFRGTNIKVTIKKKKKKLGCKTGRWTWRWARAGRKLSYLENSEIGDSVLHLKKIRPSRSAANCHGRCVDGQLTDLQTHEEMAAWATAAPYDSCYAWGGGSGPDGGGARRRRLGVVERLLGALLSPFQVSRGE